MEATDKIKKFITAQLSDVEDAQGIVTRVSLHHCVEGKISKDGEVCHIVPPYDTQWFEPDEDDEDDEDGEEPEKIVTLQLDETQLHDLANELWSGARDDAEGIGGSQSYRVLIKREHALNPTSRYNFRISGGADFEDESGVMEGTSVKGLMGQLMRHTEVAQRNASHVSMQMLSLQQRTISRQSAQIDTLVSKSFQAFELLEELTSRKHERDIENKAAENKAFITEQVVDKAMILAPIVANRLMGKKVLPEENSASEELLQSLFSQVSPAQMERLEKVLTPDQLMALGEIMDTVIDRDEKRTEKKQKQLEGRKNGRN